MVDEGREGGGKWGVGGGGRVLGRSEWGGGEAGVKKKFKRYRAYRHGRMVNIATPTAISLTSKALSAGRGEGYLLPLTG